MLNWNSAPKASDRRHLATGNLQLKYLLIETSSRWNFICKTRLSLAMDIPRATSSSLPVLNGWSMDPHIRVTTPTLEADVSVTNSRNVQGKRTTLTAQFPARYHSLCRDKGWLAGVPGLFLVNYMCHSRYIITRQIFRPPATNVFADTQEFVGRPISAPCRVMAQQNWGLSGESWERDLIFNTRVVKNFPRVTRKVNHIPSFHQHLRRNEFV